eukprot:GHVU01099303.1.p1 GENE.GHVU01099303.1~~GHVU01099303.1.p1  ORF type:complete len:638 (-),score=126.77 GHVU01099303.1:956-2869(-)
MCTRPLPPSPALPSVIICWTLIYFANSFKNPQPWVASQAELDECTRATNVADCKAVNACRWTNENNTDGYALGCHPFPVEKASYIFNTYCNIGDAITVTTFSWVILLTEFITWLIVFLMLGFGASFLGYVMYFTMGFPTATIIMLLIIAVTLPGAGLGIQSYIGKWNGEILTNSPEVWSKATGQIFFSNSLANGVMSAFGSYNKRNNPAAQDAVIVPMFNSCYSIVAGFSIFGVAGYLATSQQVSLDELQLAGSSLVFKTYPTGIAGGAIAYPGPQIILFLFFTTLMMLGTDSAVSLVEPLVNWMCATQCGIKVTRTGVVGIIASCGFLIGLVFAMDFGSVFMDEIDHFANNFALLALGLGECIGAGWVYNYEIVVDKVGAKAHYTMAGLYLGGVALFSMIGFLETSYGYIHGTVLCFTCGILGLSVPWCIVSKTDSQGNVLTNKEKAWWLYLGGVETLRNYLNHVTARGWKWYHCASFTIVWSVLVKFFIPIALIVLTGNTLFQKDGWVRAAPVWTTAVGAAIVIGFVILPILLCVCHPVTVEWMLPRSFMPNLYPEYDAELKEYEEWLAIVSGAKKPVEEALEEMEMKEQLKEELKAEVDKEQLKDELREEIAEEVKKAEEEELVDEIKKELGDE